MQPHESQIKESGLPLIRNLKLAPDGFNVRTASERELLLYGLPRRPDPNKHPQQAATWDSFASRSLRFVRPKLVPLPDRVRSQVHHYRKPELNLDAAVKDQLTHRLDIIQIHECWIVPLTSSVWSGAVVNRPTAEPLVTVTGQWVVPNVSPPQSAWNGTGYNDGIYACSVWVGLDGTSGTTDVLQAGTTSVVTVSGGTVASKTYFSWIEWFGNAATPESNFPVNPGDAILCTVCTPLGNDHGTALFTNQTTGLAMNYPIEHPDGVTLSGNVAEWIVEDPSKSVNPLVLYPFPNYGLTIFRNCSAGSKNISLTLNDSCPMNLLDSSGKVISESTIDSATSLTCNFLS